MICSDVSHIFLGTALALVGVAGCHSHQTNSDASFTQVSGKPYAIRMTAEQSVAAPGQAVAVIIEVKNTSKSPIHIPPSNLVWLSRDLHYPSGILGNSGSGSRHYWPMEPNLKPGKIHRYRKDFFAPKYSGHLCVTSSFSHDVGTWIEISTSENPAPPFDRKTRRFLNHPLGLEENPTALGETP